MRQDLAFSSLALACAGAFFSPAAAASCYVVYGPSQQVIYRSTESPVDLSYQLHQTVPVLERGATLVFSPDNHGCDFEVNLLAQAAGRQVDASSMAVPMRAPRAPRG